MWLFDPVDPSDSMNLASDAVKWVTDPTPSSGYFEDLRTDSWNYLLDWGADAVNSVDKMAKGLWDLVWLGKDLISSSAEHVFQNEDETLWIKDWDRFNKMTEWMSVKDDNQKRQTYMDMMSQWIIWQDFFDKQTALANKEKDPEKKELSEKMQETSKAYDDKMTEVLKPILEDDSISRLQRKIIHEGNNQFKQEYDALIANIYGVDKSIWFDKDAWIKKAQDRFLTNQATFMSAWAKNVARGFSDQDAYDIAIQTNKEQAADLNAFSQEFYNESNAKSQEYFLSHSGFKPTEMFNFLTGATNVIGKIYNDYIEQPMESGKQKLIWGYDIAEELANTGIIDENASMIDKWLWSLKWIGKELIDGSPSIVPIVASIVASSYVPSVWVATAETEAAALAARGIPISKSIFDMKTLWGAKAMTIVSDMAQDLFLINPAIEAAIWKPTTYEDTLLNIPFNVMVWLMHRVPTEMVNDAFGKFHENFDSTNPIDFKEYGVTERELNMLNAGNTDAAQVSFYDRMMHKDSSNIIDTTNIIPEVQAKITQLHMDVASLHNNMKKDDVSLRDKTKTFLASQWTKDLSDDELQKRVSSYMNVSDSVDELAKVNAPNEVLAKNVSQTIKEIMNSWLATPEEVDDIMTRAIAQSAKDSWENMDNLWNLSKFLIGIPHDEDALLNMKWTIDEAKAKNWIHLIMQNAWEIILNEKRNGIIQWTQMGRYVSTASGLVDTVSKKLLTEADTATLKRDEWFGFWKDSNKDSSFISINDSLGNITDTDDLVTSVFWTIDAKGHEEVTKILKNSGYDTATISPTQIANSMKSDLDLFRRRKDISTITQKEYDLLRILSWREEYVQWEKTLANGIISSLYKKDPKINLYRLDVKHVNVDEALKRLKNKMGSSSKELVDEAKNIKTSDSVAGYIQEWDIKTFYKNLEDTYKPKYGDKFVLTLDMLRNHLNSLVGSTDEYVYFRNEYWDIGRLHLWTKVNGKFDPKTGGELKYLNMEDLTKWERYPYSMEDKDGNQIPFGRFHTKKYNLSPDEVMESIRKIESSGKGLNHIYDGESLWIKSQWKDKIVWFQWEKYQIWVDEMEHLEPWTIIVNDSNRMTRQEMDQEIAYWQPKMDWLWVKVDDSLLGAFVWTPEWYQTLAKYSSGTITAYDIRQWTLSHEFWHAYMDLAMSVEQKKELFETVSKRFDIKLKDCEEFIADKISKHLEDDKSFYDILSDEHKSIFQKVIDLVLKLFKRKDIYDEMIWSVRNNKKMCDVLALTPSREIVNWLHSTSKFMRDAMNDFSETIAEKQIAFDNEYAALVASGKPQEMISRAFAKDAKANEQPIIRRLKSGWYSPYEVAFLEWTIHSVFKEKWKETMLSDIINALDNRIFDMNSHIEVSNDMTFEYFGSSFPTLAGLHSDTQKMSYMSHTRYSVIDENTIRFEEWQSDFWQKIHKLYASNESEFEDLSNAYKDKGHPYIGYKEKYDSFSDKNKIAHIKGLISAYDVSDIKNIAAAKDKLWYVYHLFTQDKQLYRKFSDEVNEILDKSEIFSALDDQFLKHNRKFIRDTVEEIWKSYSKKWIPHLLNSFMANLIKRFQNKESKVFKIVIPSTANFKIIQWGETPWELDEMQQIIDRYNKEIVPFFEDYAMRTSAILSSNKWDLVLDFSQVPLTNPYMFQRWKIIWKQEQQVNEYFLHTDKAKDKVFGPNATESDKLRIKMNVFSAIEPLFRDTALQDMLKTAFPKEWERRDFLNALADNRLHAAGFNFTIRDLYFSWAQDISDVLGKLSEIESVTERAQLWESCAAIFKDHHSEAIVDMIYEKAIWKTWLESTWIIQDMYDALLGTESTFGKLAEEYVSNKFWRSDNLSHEWVMWKLFSGMRKASEWKFDFDEFKKIIEVTAKEQKQNRKEYAALKAIISTKKPKMTIVDFNNTYPNIDERIKELDESYSILKTRNENATSFIRKMNTTSPTIDKELARKDDATFLKMWNSTKSTLDILKKSEKALFDSMKWKDDVTAFISLLAFRNKTFDIMMESNQDYPELRKYIMRSIFSDYFNNDDLISAFRELRSMSDSIGSVSFKDLKDIMMRFPTRNMIQPTDIERTIMRADRIPKEVSYIDEDKSQKVVSGNIVGMSSYVYMNKMYSSTARMMEETRKILAEWKDSTKIYDYLSQDYKINPTTKLRDYTDTISTDMLIECLKQISAMNEPFAYALERLSRSTGYSNVKWKDVAITEWIADRYIDSVLSYIPNTYVMDLEDMKMIENMYEKSKNIDDFMYEISFDHTDSESFQILKSAILFGLIPKKDVLDSRMIATRLMPFDVHMMKEHTMNTAIAILWWKLPTLEQLKNINDDIKKIYPYSMASSKFRNDESLYAYYRILSNRTLIWDVSFTEFRSILQKAKSERGENLYDSLMQIVWRASKYDQPMEITGVHSALRWITSDISKLMPEPMRLEKTDMIDELPLAEFDDEWNIILDSEMRDMLSDNTMIDIVSELNTVYSDILERQSKMLELKISDFAQGEPENIPFNAMLKYTSSLWGIITEWRFTNKERSLMLNDIHSALKKKYQLEAVKKIVDKTEYFNPVTKAFEPWAHSNIKEGYIDGLEWIYFRKLESSPTGNIVKEIGIRFDKGESPANKMMDTISAIANGLRTSLDEIMHSEWVKTLREVISVSHSEKSFSDAYSSTKLIMHPLIQSAIEELYKLRKDEAIIKSRYSDFALINAMEYYYWSANRIVKSMENKLASWKELSQWENSLYFKAAEIYNTTSSFLVDYKWFLWIGQSKTYYEKSLHSILNEMYSDIIRKSMGLKWDIIITDVSMISPIKTIKITEDNMTQEIQSIGTGLKKYDPNSLNDFEVAMYSVKSNLEDIDVVFDIASWDKMFNVKVEWWNMTISEYGLKVNPDPTTIKLNDLEAKKLDVHQKKAVCSTNP